MYVRYILHYPLYYSASLLILYGKAKKRGFSALFGLPLCRPLHCSSSPLRAASSRLFFRRCAASCPSQPRRGRRSWPSFPPQNGQTDVAARFTGVPLPPFDPGAVSQCRGRQHTPYPPLWPSRRYKLPPRIIFLFFFIHPHFYFFLIPVCCCFSIYIVFSFICPFFFDFSRSFVADDSFPIFGCFMRLNRRFLVFALCTSFACFIRGAVLRVAYIMLTLRISRILPFICVLRHFYSSADSFLVRMYFSRLNRRYCRCSYAQRVYCFPNDC